MDDIPAIGSLILKYINQTITEEEQQFLEAWAAKSDVHKRRIRQLMDIDEVNEKVVSWDKAGGDPELAWAKLQEQLSAPQKASVRKLDVKIFRYIAAAVLLGAFATIVFIEVGGKRTATKKAATETVLNDVAPGSSKAVLTLSNGKRIYLDNGQKGVIASDGSVVVSQDEQGLIYSGGEGDEVIYNTLTVPKGGQYLLVLKDGTKAWLNSGSSIRYPTAFDSDGRNVEISGEIYFEVAQIVKNSQSKAKIPFNVKVRDLKVQVLGTHFNINAYDDETDIKITLLEGKVNVSTSVNSDGKILKPGEQAISKMGQVAIYKEADLEEVMAWKNGKFYFNNTPLSAVLRQVARWYNIEIVYEGAVPSFKLNGEASRSMPLAELLKSLQMSDIKCRIEGNRLIIPEQ
ncbi:FecR family protein [Niastella sp. OAS944]|uniref:FecR family protein n=1 Tax=Niastella sp. OAS944 TaxID=2664089 RepID=UPI00347D5864|nr:ferric-dicitrate binding protein FerR (iron transport regulator) [Chitinophagaceae bacterium OAS944]